ncbi:MAG: YiiX/YebB-like N1pC/P60 family cysteine hydrolase [Methylococcales bacterium]|nr:YiiX/YebB-like N1pC/P60 family cysteine hydrolase [Methylococcales bacterium]
MKYKEIRDQLKTGDIILFSGKGGISDGIKLFTFSEWSHVGMVYRLNDPFDERGSVFCWESTTLSNIEDADSGRLTKGVQRVELSERLEKCFSSGYKICIRQLSKPLDDGMIRKLNEFRHEVSGRPYEKSKLELLKAAYDGIFGLNKEDLSSLFCSELVAEAYQRMGLLTEALPSNEYTPKDFSIERHLSLQLGYQLEHEMFVNSL